MVAVELIGILGSLAIVCGTQTNLCFIGLVGMVTFLFYSSGQTLINTLACVECYLAAVYPIFYPSLGKGKGIRIRNIAMSCAWRSTFGRTILTVAQLKLATIFLNFKCLCDYFLYFSSVFLSFVFRLVLGQGIRVEQVGMLTKQS